jgi:uncharacterized membrane protein
VGRGRRHGPSAAVRALTSLALGLLVGLGASIPATPRYGVLLGWMAAAALFVTWMWVTIWPMDADRTAAHAVAEDAGRAATDVVVVMAAVASLGAVALLLVGGAGGASKGLDAALSVLSVALAWATVHTVSATRYARLYYTGDDGGIDFNEPDPPKYSDFVYLAFTIGMTFQVSDTDLQTKAIRAAALRHALLSYLFGAVIIATTINLIAGLSK